MKKKKQHGLANKPQECGNFELPFLAYIENVQTSILGKKKIIIIIIF